jgi:hypothetical protein
MRASVFTKEMFRAWAAGDSTTLYGEAKPGTTMYHKLTKVSKATKYTPQKRAAVILEALLVFQSEWHEMFGDQAEVVRVLQHSVSLTMSMFTAPDPAAVMLVYETRRCKDTESRVLAVVDTLLGQISQARIFAILEKKKKDEEKKKEDEEKQKYPKCPGCGDRHKPRGEEHDGAKENTEPVSESK